MVILNQNQKKADEAAQEKTRTDYIEKIRRIREKRKEYRALLHDAITERNNMLKGGEVDVKKKT